VWLAVTQMKTVSCPERTDKLQLCSGGRKGPGLDIIVFLKILFFQRGAECLKVDLLKRRH